jgi:hypothetical protein
LKIRINNYSEILLIYKKLVFLAKQLEITKKFNIYILGIKYNKRETITYQGRFTRERFPEIELFIRVLEYKRAS